MIIVVTCGFLQEYCDDGQSALSLLGIEEPLKQNAAWSSPVELTRRYCRANNIGHELPDGPQISDIGRAWKILASDIILHNAEQPIWGWSEPQNIYLADFWKDFDPSTRFFLLYSSPEAALKQVISQHLGEASTQFLRDTLGRWKTYNQKILNFYLHNKDVSLLASIDTLNELSQHDEKFRDRFGLLSTFDSDRTLSDVKKSKPSEESALLDYFCQIYAEYSNGAIELFEKLEAAADIFPSLTTNGERSPECSVISIGVSNQAFSVSCDSDSTHEESTHAELENSNASNDQNSTTENSPPHPNKQGLLDDAWDNFMVLCGQIQRADGLQNRHDEELNRFQEKLNDIRNEKLMLDDKLNIEKQQTASIQSEVERLRQKLHASNAQIRNHSNKPNNANTKNTNILKKQNESISKELEETRREAEQYFLELQLLRKSYKEQKNKNEKKLDTLKKQNEHTSRELEETRQELEQAALKLRPYEDTKPEADDSQPRKQTDRNAELIKQLEQTQSELERQFLRAHSLEQELKDVKAQPVPEPITKPISPPLLPKPVDEATIDLRQFIDGENWHNAEQDGRWGGPGNDSTLKIPRLAKGRYSVSVDIVSAMNTNILNGIELSLDGRKIQCSVQYLSHLGGRSAPFRRTIARIQQHPNPYPAKITGAFAVDKVTDKPSHVLTIRAPRTIAPSELGQPDTRKLSAHVARVELKPAD